MSDLVELQCVCKLRISSFENRIARNMSNFLSEIPTLSIQAINPSAPHPTPYRVPSSDVFCKQLALASEILATRLASWIGLRAGSLIFLRRNVFQNPMDIIGFIQVPLFVEECSSLNILLVLREIVTPLFNTYSDASLRWRLPLFVEECSSLNIIPR